MTVSELGHGHHDGDTREPKPPHTHTVEDVPALQRPQQ